MGTYVVAGGNSGIGLQVVRNLLEGGHHVVMLGRDQRKGEAALASFGPARERAEFLSVDLSTLAGVREAAERIQASVDAIDGLLHSTGVIYDGDIRTADGVPLFLAVSYLGRYHLTELLLPSLLASPSPRVVMMGSYMRRVSDVDLAAFPAYDGFSFRRLIPSVNGAVMHYASHLAATHERLYAGVVCPGMVKTDIFKNASWQVKAMTTLLRPLIGTSLETAASNPTRALLSAPAGTASYWPKPSKYASVPIEVDPTTRAAVIEATRSATGG